MRIPADVRSWSPHGGRLRTAARNQGRAIARRMRPRRDEDGFIILETIVAITIITIVMTALTTLFVTVINATAHERNSQAAAQVADGAIDQVRAIGAAAAVSGRTASAVNAQFAGVSPATPAMPATAPAVAPWIASSAMQPATSTSTATPLLPTTAVVQVLNNVTFDTSYFVGWCWQVSGGTCSVTQTSGAVQYVRVVVAVAWSGQGCSALCTYLSAVLLNGTADPVFSFNQSAPPLPTIRTISNQTWAVNDVVSGPTAYANTGVPPFSFSASGLPAGLAMNSAGLISGSPTTVTSSPATVTVTVTDGFLDQATTTFTVNILSALTFANPGPRATVAGSSVSTTLTASGGAGAPYTWSATGLPSGLSINSSTGTISGTPTTPSVNPYTVSVTVTDSTTTRSYTGSFTWTVGYTALTVSNPGTQNSTVNRPASSVTPSAAGGSGSYTWSASGLPPGVSINSSTGNMSGTPTSTGTYSVTLTATDSAGSSVPNNPNTASFQWKVNAAPTVSTPSSQSGEVGLAASVSLSVSGGTSPYTGGSVSCSPAGMTTNLTVSGSTITGAPAAAGTFSCTVTVSDTYGGTGTSGAFTWTVLAQPTVTPPTGTASTVNKNGSSAAPVFTCPNANCTFTLNGAPSWLSVTSNTGVIKASSPSSTGTTSGLTLTITDHAGISVTSSPFSWTVNAAPTWSTIPAQSTTHSTSATPLNTASYVSGGTGPFTYSVSGLPSGLSINASTGVISGTASSSTGSSNVKVTVTDADGASVQSAQFTWTIT